MLPKPVMLEPFLEEREKLDVPESRVGGSRVSAAEVAVVALSKERSEIMLTVEASVSDRCCWTTRHRGGQTWSNRHRRRMRASVLTLVWKRADLDFRSVRYG